MQIPDDEILRGFIDFDAEITKEYFYGYCRRAYNMLDRQYDLQFKVGMDFYSLAHEYYITLLEHGFKTLTDKPKQMKLSAYMYKGFWFVVMDALKAHKLEYASMSKSSAADVLKYVRSTDHEEGMLEQVAEAVARHYHDRRMTELAYAFFVLGYKQNEISKELGLTPSAINQRYKKMMDEVVTPFVIENYGHGIYHGTLSPIASLCDTMALESDMAMSMPKMATENTGTQYNKPKYNMNNRTTPEFISTLKPNEIFVFGSNLRGIHAGGAARMAHQQFGAEMGNGVGIQGQSYAIPTMQGGTETIQPYVDDFIKYAKEHPDQTFLVTPIGCGIAGFEPEDIAPLFYEAVSVENIHLPEEFWELLEG